MKQKIAKKLRQLSAGEVWQGLTEEIRQGLVANEKINNASELREVMENLRSRGIADVSQLLIAAGRDKKVKVVNFNHKDGESEEHGFLDHLHLQGHAEPFLMIKLAERYKAAYSFLYGESKVINKIIKVVDEEENILYENY